MPLKKYKINYGPLEKPKANRLYVPPMSEEALKIKYKDNFENVWNHPNTVEQLLDVFGEEFFNLYDKEIIERFGEDINDTYEYLADQPNFEVPTFPELDNGLLNINNSVDNSSSDIDNSEIESQESLEYQMDENGFFYVQEERVHAHLDREKLKDEEIYDDGDFATNVEFFTKKELTDSMAVGYRALYVSNLTGLPNDFDIVGNKNTLSDALENYRVANNLPHYKFSEVGINGYAYEPKYGPYQKGRFVDEDAKRLENGVSALIDLKEQHAKHGFGYFIAHPLNYFYEWKAIHNITKTLNKIGFSDDEIEQKEKAIKDTYALKQSNKIIDKVEEEKVLSNENELDKEHVFEKDNLIGVDIANSEKEKSSFIKQDDPNKELSKSNEIDINGK